MFYRLEATWRNWERYFDNPLMYTPQRKIDAFHEHRIEFPVPAGHDICGLWFFTDPEDARAFWHTDPPGDPDEKSRAAAREIQWGGYGSGRFVVRIAPEALTGGQVLPDLPLRHERPFVFSCQTL